ncbi:MAG: biotin/lipoyl-binding protein, partial [Clostridia bacterium]|nr:biotin/lipoyl-binding protein [Clostridia bacterium]
MENQSIEPARAKKSRKKGKIKKTIIVIVVITLILAAAAYFFLPKNQSQMTSGPVYTESRVERRTIQTTLSSSGTLVPADSYNVTASVSGEILECTFEEGDTVEEDDLLYVIDSSDMENTIDRAQISYDRTLRSYNKIVDSLEDLNVYSDYNGTVINVDVQEGD